MSRTTNHICHILPSKLKMHIFLQDRNALCYYVLPTKMSSGKPTPAKLSCFPVKNILKSQCEKVATLHGDAE